MPLSNDLSSIRNRFTLEHDRVEKHETNAMVMDDGIGVTARFACDAAECTVYTEMMMGFASGKLCEGSGHTVRGVLLRQGCHSPSLRHLIDSFHYILSVLLAEIRFCLETSILSAFFLALYAAYVDVDKCRESTRWRKYPQS